MNSVPHSSPSCALAAAATLALAGLRATGGRRRQRWQRQRRTDAADGHLRRGLRRHGRPGQGRAGGGGAERHRAAAGLGQLRRDHLDVLREVRHQGQLRQPDGASQDEINAADQLAGTDRAPDVFDLGQSVALANTDMFAPYQVETWDDIPAEFKDPDGAWVNDYGGFMSIGYDSSVVPEVTSVADLLGPDFKGKVALNGNPTEAGAAFSGVVMASVANGGSADDIAPGVDFFKQLKDAGNLLPVDPTSATIESGQTPVVIDWDYLNAAEAAKIDTWEQRRAVGGPDRRLLLPGDQRRRPAPGGGPPVGGVPLQRRGPEPLARGRGSSGPGRGDGRRRHDRHRAVRRAARRSRVSRSSRRTSRPSRWPPTWRTTGRRPSAERLGTGAGDRPRRPHRRHGRVDASTSALPSGCSRSSCSS